MMRLMTVAAMLTLASFGTAMYAQSSTPPPATEKHEKKHKEKKEKKEHKEGTKKHEGEKKQ